ncbi:MAG: exo-alpha-sialidase [candidate division WOR-3 bacterium]|nr:MAG: exo-alpha-sialidase [candidate division WOR-3 bacterium]
MRSVVVLAVAVLVLPAFGQPDPPREWLVVRDTFPEFRGVPDSVIVARDMAPGTGIYEYCAGPIGFHSPVTDVNVSSCILVALADSCDSVMYFSRLSYWCHWDDPVRITPPQPDPCCPSYNVAASKVSQDVCLTWVYSPDGYSQKPGFFRISTDGGENWGDPTQLLWPPAYGGETLVSYHASSLFPFYDARGDLHIMAAVGPFLNDTNFILPAEIWHWNQTYPWWSRVHRADPESLRAPVGFNALIAGRPSLGAAPGPFDLICTWEEFDGYNVDTVTGQLRADIWTSYSDDGGDHWTPAERGTGPGSGASHRFPSICDLAIEGVSYDTCLVQYIVDQEAGFACLGEGSATQNSVVVAKFHWWGPWLVDTIGGTTQDMQCLGPAVRTLCNSEDYGVHVAWEHSTYQSGGFPDLNTRYNFYDYSAGWNWIDPDYMQSGVNVFTKRTAMGRLSADPNTGCALVSGHYLPRTGMAERKPTAYSSQPTATICRGVLRIADGRRKTVDGADLRDVTGRKVMELQPGENDIRHIAPGVYFVVTPSPLPSPPEGERRKERGPRSAVSEERSAVRKVVIQR